MTDVDWRNVPDPQKWGWTYWEGWITVSDRLEGAVPESRFDDPQLSGPPIDLSNHIRRVT